MSASQSAGAGCGHWTGDWPTGGWTTRRLDDRRLDDRRLDDRRLDDRRLDDRRLDDDRRRNDRWLGAGRWRRLYGARRYTDRSIKSHHPGDHGHDAALLILGAGRPHSIGNIFAAVIDVRKRPEIGRGHAMVAIAPAIVFLALVRDPLDGPILNRIETMHGEGIDGALLPSKRWAAGARPSCRHVIRAAGEWIAVVQMCREVCIRLAHMQRRDHVPGHACLRFDALVARLVAYELSGDSVDGRLPARHYRHSLPVRGVFRTISVE